MLEYCLPSIAPDVNSEKWNLKICPNINFFSFDYSISLAAIQTYLHKLNKYCESENLEDEKSHKFDENN